MQISMGMTVLTQKKIERAEFDRRMEEHAKWLKNHEEGSLKKANFLEAQICNCDFTGSDLEEACFVCADFDDSIFVNTKLCNADFDYAKRTYWTDFSGSDMTGLSTADVDFDPDYLKGVKGLHMHLFCPEFCPFTSGRRGTTG